MLVILLQVRNLVPGSVDSIKECWRVILQQRAELIVLVIVHGALVFRQRIMMLIAVNYWPLANLSGTINVTATGNIGAADHHKPFSEAMHSLASGPSSVYRPGDCVRGFALMFFRNPMGNKRLLCIRAE